MLRRSVVLGSSSFRQATSRVQVLRQQLITVLYCTCTVDWGASQCTGNKVFAVGPTNRSFTLYRSRSTSDRVFSPCDASPLFFIALTMMMMMMMESSPASPLAATQQFLYSSTPELYNSAIELRPETNPIFFFASSLCIFFSSSKVEGG